MKFILVEVTPREEDDLYQASLGGNNGRFGKGKYIEGAILNCITANPDVFKLTSDEITNGKKLVGKLLMMATLRKFIKLLSERGFELEIKFFPCEFR
jgi:hypothetical protein